MNIFLEWITKKFKWFLQKKAMKTSATVMMLLMMVIIIIFQSGKIDKLKIDYSTEIKLRNALSDSVKYYQNVKEELVAEKLTIQESIKNLEKINGKLTENQKELLRRIKTIGKEKDIINAALIISEARIDSLETLTQTFIADTINKTLTYIDSTEFIKYNILTHNAILADKNKKSTLMFVELSMPNKQFVDFFWKDERKEGYPVAFSVSNSNKYFKVSDIQSYAIPELLKPKTGWDKFNGWVNKNGKWVLIGTAGVIGASGVYFIMK